MHVPEVDCATAVSMHAAGAAWIDVREQAEWAQMRIDGTELVPLMRAVEELPRRFPDKATTIVLVCHSGSRSGQLTAYLRQQGYTDVHNQRGGMIAWATQGRPLVTG